MNFNENIKNDKKSLKPINQLLSGPNCYWDTVIEPEISYDKFIDDLGLYEIYLICIFMNVNQNVKNCGKMREKLYLLQGIG